MHNDFGDIRSCLMPSCTEHKRYALYIQVAVLANLQQETGVSGWENHRISYVIYFGNVHIIWPLKCKSISNKSAYVYTDYIMHHSWYCRQGNQESDEQKTSTLRLLLTSEETGGIWYWSSFHGILQVIQCTVKPLILVAPELAIKLLITQMYLEHRLSVLLQLHLDS